MSLRAVLLAVGLAVPAAAQPLDTSPQIVGAYTVVGLGATDGALDGLTSGPPRKAPPVLYAIGVAADAAVLGGGAYLLVVAVDTIRQADTAGLAAPAVLTMGGLFAAIGAGAMLLSGNDLRRVIRGDDPALARALMTPLPPRPRPPLR